MIFLRPKPKNGGGPHAGILKSPPVFFMLIFMFFPAAVYGQSNKDEAVRFYFNLFDNTIYLRVGFNAGLINKRPGLGDTAWDVILPQKNGRYKALRVKDLEIPGITEFKYPRPFGYKVMQFTIIIPFTVSDDEYSLLNNSPPLIPALFLAGIGDNWEVYLNGNLARSEMHLDSQGRITSHRNYRDQYFPLERTFFKKGENILAFRIAGDPLLGDTGLFYSYPYYIGDYNYIARGTNDIFTVMVTAVFCFMAVYCFCMFLYTPKKISSLFYALLVLFTGLYYFITTADVYFFVSNGEILTKTEYITLFMILPFGILFIEYFFLNKAIFVSKFCIALYSVFSVLTAVFSLSFATDMLRIWQISMITVMPSALIFDVIYILKPVAQKIKLESRYNIISPFKLYSKALRESQMDIFIFAILLFLVFATIDIITSRIMLRHLNLSRYGALLFATANAILLGLRMEILNARHERIIKRSYKCMNQKLVNYIMTDDKDPEYLAPINTEQAIMFTDVRNFTHISEKIGPKKTTEFLHSLYKTISVPIIERENSGILAYTDKFMGDGMMNIFDSPEESLRTAIEMRQRAREYNKNVRDLFPSMIEDFKIDIGVGISYGMVTMGVMGHERRLDYTPIGDTVNIASRLETLTKIYHTPILITSSLYERVDKQKGFLRLIDKIRVKGKDTPIDIYEEYSMNSPIIRDIKRELLPHIIELQEMYFTGNNWPEARRMAEYLIKTYSDIAVRNHLGHKPVDYVPHIYLERMRVISESPDLFEKWDGIYTFN